MGLGAVETIKCFHIYATGVSEKWEKQIGPENFYSWTKVIQTKNSYIFIYFMCTCVCMGMCLLQSANVGQKLAYGHCISPTVWVLGTELKSS